MPVIPMPQDGRTVAAMPMGRCTQVLAGGTRTALSEGLLQDGVASITRCGNSKRAAFLIPAIGLVAVALFSVMPHSGGENVVQLSALTVPAARAHSPTSVTTPRRTANVAAQPLIVVRPQVGPLLTCVAREHIKSRRASTSARNDVGDSHVIRTVDAAPLITSKQILRPVEATNPIEAKQLELVANLDSWAETDLMPILLDANKSWQPQDFLPDPSSPDFLDELAEIQRLTKDIPDEVMVSLVGDMVTEEALPTYQTMLNTLDGTRDETGADAHPWARWTRAWTAEENRHGDLMNKYLWMTGRVNMKSVEKTIQYLIGSGMNPKTDNNPYLGMLYTSFQERATRISHGNTADLAAKYGDKHLGKICRFIAADEARHETAYKKVVSKLFEMDPEGTMHCYEDMMKKQIVMPAHLMYDGENDNLWNEFSGTAEKIGVYTAYDYADIMEHCNEHWGIADKTFKGDAEKSQEYVMKLPNRIRKLAEMADKRKKKLDLREARISWVFNRPTKY